MGRSRTSQAIDKIIQQRVASEQFGRHLLDQTGASNKIDEAQTKATEAKTAVDNANLPVNDGLAPAAPTLLTSNVFFHDILIGWAEPPAGDHVNLSRLTVKLTADGTIVSTHETKDIIFLVSGLTPGTSYTFEVRHVDMFGLVSAAATITGVPEPTVAERITSATSVAAGEISNLLNDPGLAAITDPTKLAEGTVRSASLAMANNPNLLAWDEAEFSNHAVGTSLGFNGIDITNSVVLHNTRNWLKINLAVAGTHRVHIPFTTVKDRTDRENGWYIWSAEVYNPGTADMPVYLQSYRYDAANTLVDVVSGNNTIIPPKQKRQVFVKFERTAATPRQRVSTVLAGTIGDIYINRFMLQKSDAVSTEPAPYVPPGLSTGVVAADLLSAWTVAAGKAIIANATIDTALIADLAVTDAKIHKMTVSKLLAGNLDVAMNVVVGGKISSGGASLDNLGVTLQDFGDSLGNPSSNAADWITPRVTPNQLPSPFAGVGFFNTSTAPAKRGVTIRADGVSGAGKEGNISLMVTEGGQNYGATSTAHLGLLSQSGGFGQIYMKQDVVIERDLGVKRHLDVFGNTGISGNLTIGGRWTPSVVASGNVIAGDWLQFNFPANWPTRPYFAQAWVDTNGNGTWRPHHEASCTFLMTTTFLRVTNNGTTTSFIRLVIYK